MRIYPAIDIKDGKCVRLKQGSFNDLTVYEQNPLNAAERWAKAGASYIHIVDLDGAVRGIGVNDEIIKNIIEKYNIPIQTGGGIRSMEDIDKKINIGVSRVIIGTAAVKNPELVKEAVKKYGDKIAVGIDAKDGMVAIEGWEEVSQISAIELCKSMAEYGVKTIIYTDISKDGMMSGANIESTREIIEASKVDVIISGGVSSEVDIEAASKINAHGAIIGKALYTGAIDLKKIIEKYEK